MKNIPIESPTSALRLLTSMVLAAAAAACGTGATSVEKAPHVASAPAGRARSAPCKEPKLVALDRALAEAPIDDRGDLAVESIANACELPSVLADGLERLRRSGRDNEGVVVAKIAAKILQEEGKRSARSDAAIDDFAKKFLLWTHGDIPLDDIEVATAGEWSTARHRALALLVRSALIDDGVRRDRIRTYVRAIAELDRAPDQMLVERYPLVTPRPTKIAAPSLAMRLVSYEGWENLAIGYTDKLKTGAASLALCFTEPRAPSTVVLQLRIADGVAQDGELLSREVSGPHTTRIGKLATEPAFRQCILSSAGTLRFENDARVTTIDVEMAATAP